MYTADLLLVTALIAGRNRADYHDWFEHDAAMNTTLSYVKSGWDYFPTAADYYAIIDDPATAARIKANSTVLELGCGVGASLQRLVETRRISPKVHGIDFSSTAISAARTALPAGTFIKGDIAGRLPFADNSMDHVVSFGAVGMYLTHKEMAHVVREASRVVRPGGTVLFTQFVEPWSLHRGSILAPIPRPRWPSLTRGFGHHLIVRSHRNTMKGCRYYILFTVPLPGGRAASVSTLGRRPRHCRKVVPFI